MTFTLRYLLTGEVLRSLVAYFFIRASKRSEENETNDECIAYAPI
jgi:hypothetical protein